MSVRWPSALWDTQGSHSSNLYPTALPDLDGAALVAGPKYGLTTFYGVVSEPALHLAGVIWGAINFSFYGRILIIPSFYDVGNILDNQTRVIQVWNGFVTTKPMSDFIKENDEGIDTFEPVTPPYTIRPLEMLDYTFLIKLTGPVAIDAQFTWVIAGASYVANIVGSRVVVFPFLPNYREAISETLEWKTDILRVYSGEEQRRALRVIPRRGLRFTFSLMEREDGQLFRNLMWGWQNRAFAVPVWTDRVFTSSAHAIGTTTLSVNPTNYSFVVGGLAMLIHDIRNYETAEILTVNATTLTLKRGLQKAWPANTPVYPVIIGHLPQDLTNQQLTNTVNEGTAIFTTSPDATDPYTPEAAPPTAYDGLEVITVQPNWANALDANTQYAFDTVDYDVGPVRWETTEIYPRTLRRYEWIFTKRSDMFEFRKMLARRAGRAKPCWIPTWTDDFEIINTVGFNAFSIDVKDNGFRQMVGLTTANDRLMLRTTTGAIYYRRITSVTTAEDDVNTSLSIDAPLGVTYTADQFKPVHMLNRCCLTTDKLELQWHSNNTMQVQAMFNTVPQ